MKVCDIITLRGEQREIHTHTVALYNNILMPFTFTKTENYTKETKIKDYTKEINTSKSF